MGDHVPDVVYTCGALLRGETLVLPYGFSDAAIWGALVGLPQLIARLAERA